MGILVLTGLFKKDLQGFCKGSLKGSLRRIYKGSICKVPEKSSLKGNLEGFHKFLKKVP